MKSLWHVCLISMIGTIAFAQPTPIPGKLDEVFIGTVDAATKDVVFAYEAEPGATYEVFLVDGFNNGADEKMKLETPSKAIVFWVLKEDGKTSYPQNNYTFTDPEQDASSPFSFVGETPEKSAGPSARIKAESARFFVQVQRGRPKPAYYGQFAIKVVRR